MIIDTRIEDTEMIAMMEQALASVKSRERRTPLESQQQIEARVLEMREREARRNPLR